MLALSDAKASPDATKKRTLLVFLLGDMMIFVLAQLCGLDHSPQGSPSIWLASWERTVLLRNLILSLQVGVQAQTKVYQHGEPYKYPSCGLRLAASVCMNGRTRP